MGSVVIDLSTALASSERRLFDRYGVAVRSRLIKLGRPELRTRVLEVGEGPPVLFIHGAGASAAVWTPLLQQLGGYHLIAVDRPGCGHADPFGYRDVDLRTHGVDFLESILDVLELDRVGIVGNSMGGLWSFWLALERPERVSTIAQLGCPALLLDTSAPLAMRLLSLPGVRVRPVTGEDRGRSMVRNVVGAPAYERMSEEMIDSLQLCETEWARSPTRLSLIQRALGPTGARPEYRLGEEELARIEQPTLFVWGDQDVFGRTDVGDQACSIMRRASIEVLPAGHLPWLDHPILVGAHLRGFFQKSGSSD
jgi:2-hydroxy-6-oxonona-2,4-dienedioate hydrolase